MLDTPEKTPSGSKRFIALLLWGTLPLLAGLAVNLWAREPYQYFPFVWGIAFILWWHRSQAVDPQPSGRNLGTSISWGLGALLLVAALVLWSPWLGGLSFVAFLAGWSIRQQGKLAWKLSLPVLLLFLATLPPPLRLDETLLLKLKEIAVTLSSRFLDLRGIVHVRAGSTIELPRESLLVEEACSGINSFLSVMAAGLFIVIFERRKWWHALLVMGFTAFMVIAANVFRITAATTLKVENGIDLLRGAAHEWTGLGMFFFAVFAVWSFDRLMAFFSTRTALQVSTVISGKVVSTTTPEPKTPRLASSPSVLPLPRALAFFFMLTGAAGIVRGGIHWFRPGPPAGGYIPAIAEAGVQKFELDPVIQGWQQMKDAPEEKKAEVLGVQSRAWYFTRNGLVVSVAIDYPFSEFHDVSQCYVGAGWKPESSQPFSNFGESGQPATRLSFTKTSLMRAEVLSANFLSADQWVNPVQERAGEKTPARLVSRFLGGETTQAPSPPQYRVQALWNGVTPLLPPDRVAIEQLFDTVRLELARQSRPKP